MQVNMTEVFSRRSFLTATASMAAVGSGFELLNGQPATASSYRTIFKLPEHSGSVLAWTVDDGGSSQAVANFAHMVQESDIKLTFFVTSSYSPWRKNAHLLRELVHAGKIQLANHTYTHAKLTQLSSAGIHRQLRECEKFIHGEFGVNPRPFFRPPGGFYNTYVQQAAADIGYTVNTMWNASMPLDPRSKPWMIKYHARKSMHTGNIVIDHANWPFEGPQDDYIVKLIKDRGLTTKKLNEIFK
jgi:peptidoglycan/xylan/chitin deacetylase (PgdA/CDA1 family)